MRRLVATTVTLIYRTFRCPTCLLLCNAVTCHGHQSSDLWLPLPHFPRTFLCTQKLAGPEAEAIMGDFDHRWRLAGAVFSVEVSSHAVVVAYFHACHPEP